eukprot:TRINITY_DN948_c0_g2_i2.p1 TRINITY_DN948_c0_g2~~TRINITY_DN948_c0_g2_i2.p1  ORF type:complete len:2902 (+),score=580.45 TRINITY_DN948_c0_g2_i2:998-8707(+)
MNKKERERHNQPCGTCKNASNNLYISKDDEEILCQMCLLNQADFTELRTQLYHNLSQSERVPDHQLGIHFTDFTVLELHKDITIGIGDFNFKCKKWFDDAMKREPEDNKKIKEFLASKIESIRSMLSKERNKVNIVKKLQISLQKEIDSDRNYRRRENLLNFVSLMMVGALIEFKPDTIQYASDENLNSVKKKILNMLQSNNQTFKNGLYHLSDLEMYFYKQLLETSSSDHLHLASPISFLDFIVSYGLVEPVSEVLRSYYTSRGSKKGRDTAITEEFSDKVNELEGLMKEKFQQLSVLDSNEKILKGLFKVLNESIDRYVETHECDESSIKEGFLPYLSMNSEKFTSIKEYIEENFRTSKTTTITSTPSSDSSKHIEILSNLLDEWDRERDVEKMILNYFDVPSIVSLGYSSFNEVKRKKELISDIKNDVESSTNNNVSGSGALKGKNHVKKLQVDLVKNSHIECSMMKIRSTKSEENILQSREYAISLIRSCPNLMDIGQWTNWSMLYQSSFGDLTGFLGSTVELEDLKFLEIGYNQFVKYVVPQNKLFESVRLGKGLDISNQYEIIEIARQVASELVGVYVDQKVMMVERLASDFTELLRYFLPEDGSITSVSYWKCRLGMSVIKILPKKLHFVIGYQCIIRSIVPKLVDKKTFLSNCIDYEEKMILYTLNLFDRQYQDVSDDDILQYWMSEWRNSTTTYNVKSVKQGVTDVESPSSTSQVDNVNNVPRSVDVSNKQPEKLGDDKQIVNETKTITTTTNTTAIKAPTNTSQTTATKSSTPSSTTSSASTTIALTPKPLDRGSTIKIISSPEYIKDMKQKLHEKLNFVFVDNEEECLEVYKTIKDSRGANEKSKAFENLRALLHRATQKVSGDLYSEESHTIFELTQNADDNFYPEDVVPTLEIKMFQENGQHYLVVDNNEIGFSKRNVEAICDISKSHKKGAEYIGNKGIGFKSVFKITENPHIHSNYFHFQFNIETGCLEPHEISKENYPDSWDPTINRTLIRIPLNKDVRLTPFCNKLDEIHSSLLLFLKKLECLSISLYQNEKIGDRYWSYRKYHKKSEGEFVVVYFEETKRNPIGNEKPTTKCSHNWLVVEEEIDIVDCQSLFGDNEKTTVISMAFKESIVDHSVFREEVYLNILNYDNKFPSEVRKMLSNVEQHDVFAYLPIRQYGLKFIIQANWILTSNRESVDASKDRNTLLRSHLPKLFAKSISKFVELIEMYTKEEREDSIEEDDYEEEEDDSEYDEVIEKDNNKKKIKQESNVQDDVDNDDDNQFEEAKAIIQYSEYSIGLANMMFNMIPYGLSDFFKDLTTQIIALLYDARFVPTMNKKCEVPHNTILSPINLLTNQSSTSEVIDLMEYTTNVLEKINTSGKLPTVFTHPLVGISDQLVHDLRINRLDSKLIYNILDHWSNWRKSVSSTTSSRADNKKLFSWLSWLLGILGKDSTFRPKDFRKIPFIPLENGDFVSLENRKVFAALTPTQTLDAPSKKIFSSFIVNSDFMNEIRSNKSALTALKDLNILECTEHNILEQVAITPLSSKSTPEKDLVILVLLIIKHTRNCQECTKKAKNKERNPWLMGLPIGSSFFVVSSKSNNDNAEKEKILVTKKDKTTFTFGDDLVSKPIIIHPECFRSKFDVEDGAKTLFKELYSLLSDDFGYSYLYRNYVASSSKSTNKDDSIVDGSIHFLYSLGAWPLFPLTQQNNVVEVTIILENNQIQLLKSSHPLPESDKLIKSLQNLSTKDIFKSSNTYTMKVSYTDWVCEEIDKILDSLTTNDLTEQFLTLLTSSFVWDDCYQNYTRTTLVLPQDIQSSCESIQIQSSWLREIKTKQWVVIKDTNEKKHITSLYDPRMKRELGDITGCILPIISSSGHKISEKAASNLEIQTEIGPETVIQILKELSRKGELEQLSLSCANMLKLYKKLSDAVQKSDLNINDLLQKYDMEYLPIFVPNHQVITNKGVKEKLKGSFYRPCNCVLRDTGEMIDQEGSVKRFDNTLMLMRKYCNYRKITKFYEPSSESVFSKLNVCQASEEEVYLDIIRSVSQNTELQPHDLQTISLLYGALAWNVYVCYDDDKKIELAKNIYNALKDMPILWTDRSWQKPSNPNLVLHNGNYVSLNENIIVVTDYVLKKKPTSSQSVFFNEILSIPSYDSANDEILITTRNYTFNVKNSINVDCPLKQEELFTVFIHLWSRNLGKKGLQDMAKYKFCTCDSIKLEKVVERVYLDSNQKIKTTINSKDIMHYDDEENFVIYHRNDVPIDTIIYEFAMKKNAISLIRELSDIKDKLPKLCFESVEKYLSRTLNRPTSEEAIEILQDLYQQSGLEFKRNDPKYPEPNSPGTNYPGTNYPGANYPGTNYPGTNYPGTNYSRKPKNPKPFVTNHPRFSPSDVSDVSITTIDINDADLPNFLHGIHPNESEIDGRVGESLVYQYLVKHTELGYYEVQWLNETEEQGLPFDLVAIKDQRTIKIEVKSTNRLGSVYVSKLEIDEATMERDNYHLFIVVSNKHIYTVVDPAHTLKTFWYSPHLTEQSTSITTSSPSSSSISSSSISTSSPSSSMSSSMSTSSPSSS